MEEILANVPKCLNPLYVVECFRSSRCQEGYDDQDVLIHCVSWNAFGVQRGTYVSTKLFRS